MAKMMSSAYYYLFFISSIITLVLANTEKIIFTAPPPSIIPLAKPSIEDLSLGVLTGDWRNLRVELPRIFPETPHDASSGQSSWWLMDDLIEGKVYEMRVCWAATVCEQPPTCLLVANTGRIYRNHQLLKWAYMKWIMCFKRQSC